MFDDEETDATELFMVGCIGFSTFSTFSTFSIITFLFSIQLRCPSLLSHRSIFVVLKMSV